MPGSRAPSDGRTQGAHSRSYGRDRGRPSAPRDRGPGAAKCRREGHVTKSVFLVNPASANGTTGRRWPEIARRAAAAGLNGDALLSRAPGELTELARRAADDGAGLLVVVGGDGSVNEVVNGIAGREGVEVAVIARGTGWDFARSLGLPRRLDQAVAVALQGRTRTIDLGWVTYRPWAGGEARLWFANVASVGMSGVIAQRANDTTKALGGKVSYAWETL